MVLQRDEQGPVWFLSLWHVAIEIKAKELRLEVHPPGDSGMLGLQRERGEEKMKRHSRS